MPSNITENTKSYRKQCVTCGRDDWEATPSLSPSSLIHLFGAIHFTPSILMKTYTDSMSPLVNLSQYNVLQPFQGIQHHLNMVIFKLCENTNFEIFLNLRLSPPPKVALPSERPPFRKVRCNKQGLSFSLWACSFLFLSWQSKCPGLGASGREKEVFSWEALIWASAWMCSARWGWVKLNPFSSARVPGGLGVHPAAGSLSSVLPNRQIRLFFWGLT